VSHQQVTGSGRLGRCVVLTIKHQLGPAWQELAGATHTSASACQLRQDVRTFCTSSSGDPLRQLTCTDGMWEVVGDGRRRGSLLHDCYPVDCEPSLIRTMDIACISTGAGVEGVNQVGVQIKRNL
jgi:hypothetical protein